MGLSYRQLRYLYAVGAFQRGKSLSVLHAQKSTAPRRAPKFIDTKDLAQARQSLVALAKSSPAGPTGHFFTIGSQKVELHRNPGSTDRFVASLVDSTGEPAAIGFYADDIEQHGIKKITPAEFHSKFKDFSTDVSPQTAKEKIAEYKKQVKKLYPKMKLTIDSVDPQGTVDFFKQGLPETIQSLLPDIDKFKGKKMSMSLESTHLGRSGVSHKLTLQVHDTTIDPEDIIHIERNYFTADKVVEHEGFSIHPSLQGQGIGKKAFDSHVELAKKAGMTAIQTYANCDVGGYMWAKQGFKSIDPEFDNQQLTKRLMYLKADLKTSPKLLPSVTPADVKRFETFLKTTPSMEDIANYPKRLGASLLLGSHWYARKEL